MAYVSSRRSARLSAVIAIIFLSRYVAAEDSVELFERHVRPVLLERCVSCHGPDQQESGVRLDSREQILHGTEELDPLVIPGNPDASRLMQVVLYSEDDTQMPPKAKLPETVLAGIRRWIATGAEWPDDSEFGRAEAFDADAWKRHWAFQPVREPVRPDFGADNWHPIDVFIRHRLAERNSTASPLADGRTLVRRISYATKGLPPELSELKRVAEIEQSGGDVGAFLHDYIDRGLASPHYGERWARYWLDIARYADTKGYVFREDREYKDAWRYRDWVINAINADMPYDEFLKRQIAADQLPGNDDPSQLAAMGFLTLGRRFLNNKHDIIDDRIDVLTRGTMGLTVSCARCHDHKFDPIPTADYYSLYGVFDSSDEPKNEPSTLRLVDRPKPREPFIFVRGGAGNRGERVSRHFLTALSDNYEPQPFQNGSGRLELAERIAASENPLTARVAVNRIWIRLFGRGLVDSPSDFGVRTPRPVHGDLLDHLANWLVEHNWSRKALIKYILVSHTWLQSSNDRPELVEADPENRLLARMPRRRLDFEAFRDSLLSVSGRLEPDVGGESVDITKAPYGTRRTLYARIDRQNLPNVFRTFDFASPDNHSPQRFETTVPQQALFQFNSEFVLQTSEAIAKQVVGSNDSVESTVRKLFELILKRAPTADERLWATDYFHLMTAEQFDGGPVGWQYGWGELPGDFSHVINFQLLPRFAEGRWGGGVSLPDTKLGWCMLNRTGGHTGHGLHFCPVRRWTADCDCEVVVSGVVEHPADAGDGIRCHVISNGRRLGHVQVRHGRAELGVKRYSLKQGQTIDFAADCIANESHDSFHWKFVVKKFVGGRLVETMKSEDEFSGRQAGVAPNAVQQLAQILLLTNEFLFVD